MQTINRDTSNPRSAVKCETTRLTGVIKHISCTRSMSTETHATHSKKRKEICSHTVAIFKYFGVLTNTPVSLSSIQCFGAATRFRCFFGPLAWRNTHRNCQSTNVKNRRWCSLNAGIAGHLDRKMFTAPASCAGVLCECSANVAGCGLAAQPYSRVT